MPVPTPGQIQSGRRLDIQDIQNVLAGAIPADLEQFQDVDYVEMPAVPEGKFRVIVSACATNANASSACYIYILRRAVYYTVAIPSANYAVAAVNSTGAIVRGLLLLPGDVICADDINGVGGTVDLDVMYKDVFL